MSRGRSRYGSSCAACSVCSGPFPGVCRDRGLLRPYAWCGNIQMFSELKKTSVNGGDMQFIPWLFLIAQGGIVVASLLGYGIFTSRPDLLVQVDPQARFFTWAF